MEEFNFDITGLQLGLQIALEVTNNQSSSKS